MVWLLLWMLYLISYYSHCWCNIHNHCYYCNLIVVIVIFIILLVSPLFLFLLLALLYMYWWQWQDNDASFRLTFPFSHCCFCDSLLLLLPIGVLFFITHTVFAAAAAARRWLSSTSTSFLIFECYNFGLQISASFEANDESIQVHHCICHRAWHLSVIKLKTNWRKR